MTFDETITAVVYLIAVFILFFLGKIIYDKLYTSFDLQEELVKNDNFALGLALFGYYFGMVIALGGVLQGESQGLVNDLIDIFIYGLAAIILQNISIRINDKIIFHKFDNIKELVEDRNPGIGIAEAANHIAIGLVLYGAMAGEGDLLTAAVFWLLGQATLVVASVIYNNILPFDLNYELEKDNAAVGVAYAGMLIAIGNIIRVGSEGDFISWYENGIVYIGFVTFGLLMLPILRLMADKLLLPGEQLTDELVNQKVPNVAAGAMEACSYIGASFLIGWVV